MSLALGNAASPVPNMSKRIFLKWSAVAGIMLATGCASMQTIETVESTEKRIQKKFAWMPLIFGIKTNTIPDNIQVVASKDKKGIFILKLPFLEKVTKQDFEVRENWDISSETIIITLAPFDIIAIGIANRLNLKEGEKYKVTIEWWTVHIRLLPSNTSTDIASSDGNAI